MTNAQACPVTCGTCATTPKISVSVDSVDITYSLALHEAIILYAHAATKVLSNGGDLRDGKAVAAAVRGTTFQPVVGQSIVSLDNNGDRIEFIR